MSNRLDPDQAQRFVGPDLGPICLQSYEQTKLGVVVNYFSALVIHDGDEAEESLETEHDKRKRVVSYTS